MDGQLERYRVNISVAGLKAHELIDIDPDLPEWRVCIDAGWIRPEPIEDTPVLDGHEPE